MTAESGAAARHSVIPERYDMNSREIMAELFAPAENGFDYSKTCDTCKSGAPEAEVSRVGVTMFATPETIRAAAAWGAQLLIVHEPTFYNHMDVESDEPVEQMKRKLVADSGMVIWRFHDHAHHLPADVICAGVFRELDLDAEIDYTRGVSLVDPRATLRVPMTPREMARRIEKKLGVAHVRICGAADVPCTKLTAMVGAPGKIVFDELKNEDSEMILTGETCEWGYGEYARDAAYFGLKKALLILGHVGSERAGMALVADQLAAAHPELSVKYFDTPEVYTYTDK